MRYFTIAELTRSATATAMGINNTPSLADVRNLTALVDRVLDPLREAWGSAIIVNSGYRSKELNKAVGGATTSQHCKGMAADITPKNGNVDGLFALARRMGRFDQLIDEYSGGSHWVHVSLDPTKVRQRGEVLRYKNGKYVRI